MLSPATAPPARRTVMGLLANIFVALTKSPPDPEEEPEVPDGHGIQLKSITSLELSTLWAIIDAVEWTADRMDDFESLVPSEEGPWLDRCPPGLAASLRQVQDADVDRMARAWAATEEMRGWEPDDARALIAELRPLAQLAGRRGQSLYIWTCL
jgi:hypothetical protein